ncbi:hypothetical protein, partial [Xanthomonas fragariae]|uniref:hypothetical protein n=1 Tax=Xanthomonas fragariae TaxID=48664 RepID=UPI001F18B255
GRLATDHDLRHALEVQDVALSLNALSKSLGGAACRQAALLLAERPGSAELPWQQFDMLGLAQLGNAHKYRYRS